MVFVGDCLAKTNKILILRYEIKSADEYPRRTINIIKGLKQWLARKSASHCCFIYIIIRSNLNLVIFYVSFYSSKVSKNTVSLRFFHAFLGYIANEAHHQTARVKDFLFAHALRVELIAVCKFEPLACYSCRENHSFEF